MIGVDPYAYLHKVSENLDSLTDYNQIQTVLDEVEYLFEVIPPELQELAEPLIDQLRAKLAQSK